MANVAETLRAIAAWVESSSPPGPDTNRELAALDTALQALEIVERLAQQFPWVGDGGIGSAVSGEYCRFCGSTSRTRTHPDTEKCLWLAARAVCPGPSEER